MTNESKIEPREQMNRALKPGDVRILNLLQPYFNAYAVQIFTSNAFSICLDGHFKFDYKLRKILALKTILGPFLTCFC